MKTRLVHYLNIAANGSWKCSCGAFDDNKKSAEVHEARQMRKSSPIVLAVENEAVSSLSISRN